MLRFLEALILIPIAVVLVAFRGRKEQPAEDQPAPSFSGLENVPTKPDFGKLADSAMTQDPAADKHSTD